MFFYTINNLALLVWSAIFCFHKPNKVKNLFFIIIAFAQLTVISVVRYQIGYDYNMYTVGFRYMTEDGFSNLTYKDWEIGFVLLSKILGVILPQNLFVPTFVWYIGIFSVLTVVPAGIFIYRNSDMPWLSTILYVNLFMYFMTMNFIRQAVAVSLVMLSWEFAKKHKFIPFLIVILIASLFHQTVLLLIPIYFLIKMTPNLKELIVYSYILLWFYIASTDMINLMTTFYHEEYAESVFVTEGLSIVYVLFPTFITIISFLLVKTGTINLTKENKYIINLTLVGMLFSITMTRHSILERLSYYTLLFSILLVPIIYRSLKINGIKYELSNAKTIVWTSDKSKKILSTIFIILALGLSYLHFYYGLNENAHGVGTFKTWLR